ncbi:hypothetical protein TRFO_27114 [Tritrichomonas foetus]|uniref:Uncharacterized protein n=1 Tax=Tritrichomonas foetus TaxID=1144522 RepID=A0A1J4K1H5_9EUKA|nr:hypothetical protein TRFO_27114 [Tritrichomonas foetus]|eukprot:OHT05239.1 hypothetical protein TRFO_27114 [Tritrichomonas foetus]
MDFLDVLELVCTDDKKTQTNALTVLLNISFTKYEDLLSHLEDLYLIISIFCSGEEPKWGSISFICFSISNALSNALENKYKFTSNIFLILLNISLEITKSYFSRRPTNDFDFSFFQMFTKSIVKASNSNIEMNDELFLLFTEHCLIGFLENSSLVEILVRNFSQIETIFMECDVSHYRKFAEPLSSSNYEVSLFYTSLWINLISLDNFPMSPFFKNALKSQSAHFMTVLSNKIGEKIESDKNPFAQLLQVSAKFFIIFLKTDQKDSNNNTLRKEASVISELLYNRFNHILKGES